MSQHYWRYQFAGWMTLLALDFFGKLLANMLLPPLLMAVLILYSFGLLASHGLRYVYKHHMRGFPIWLVIPTALILSLLAALFATASMMAILYVFSHPAFSQDNAKPEQIFIYNLFLMWLFLFIWTGLYLFITRQRQVDALNQQQQHLQNNLEQSQLHALLNQLNPHFMFNCINNIRALILEDSDKAREMLAHMADMLRYNLQDQQQAQETIAKELAIAHAYMQLASIQFENRLRYTQSVDTSVDFNWFIPRMLIQLLLENAVKHGIAHLPQGGEVSLKLWSSQTDLHIAVTNHGHLPQNPDQGIGLQNIRSRLNMLYGTQTNFTLFQQDDKVQALTTIPINKVIEVASSHS